MQESKQEVPKVVSLIKVGIITNKSIKSLKFKYNTKQVKGGWFSMTLSHVENGSCGPADRRVRYLWVHILETLGQNKLNFSVGGSQQDILIHWVEFWSIWKLKTWNIAFISEKKYKNTQVKNNKQSKNEKTF